MRQKSIFGLLLCILAASGVSDTFKNKETGETFTGFVTQKTVGGMTRVYDSDEKKFVPLKLNEYEVTFNAEGRRENIVLVLITQPEVLMSQTVAEQAAQAIVDASNAGPLAILVQIDSPGGRGEYMKIIASAIAQTTNCPVAAYISGGSYGGAFNAAAVIALACDKIFISPTAAMGAVGPLVGTSRTSDDYDAFLKTYAPETLATYSSYVSALAQEHNRPPILARGLIDRRLSIIEVTNPNGSRSYVLKDERQPDQTIIRTMAEGVSSSQEQSAESKAAVSAVDITGAVLNLTADEAVKTGLADEIAASRQDVLTAMGLGTTQVVPAQGISNVIKKFAAAKRNIATGLARIDGLETQAKTLDDNLQQIVQQLQTGQQTRETLRVTPRQNTQIYENRNSRFDNASRPSDRFPASTRERVITTEPTANPQILQQQLAGVLRQLTSEYRRVINLADRWPGGLPVDLSLNTLQSNLNSATAQLNNLYNAPVMTANPNINQNQGATPYQNTNPYQNPYQNTSPYQGSSPYRQGGY